MLPVIVAVLFVLIVLVIAFFFCTAFVRYEPKHPTPTDIKVNKTIEPYREIIRSGLKFNRETPHITVNVKSFDGLNLVADYYKNGDSKETVVMFHGYRSVATRDFSRAVNIFYDMGFNILLVDQRAHGRSDGKIITFGIKERKDVVTWCEYLNKSFDTEKIFLCGISMGASTILFSADLNLSSNVVGMIADCGFDSPAGIIKKVAKSDYHISGNIAVPIINLVCKMFFGFNLYSVSSEEALKNNKIPILFIHGRNDGFVPCYMSESAYNAATCEKDIIIVDGADHGMSYLIDTEGVMEKYRSFVNKYR